MNRKLESILTCVQSFDQISIVDDEISLIKDAKDGCHWESGSGWKVLREKQKKMCENRRHDKYFVMCEGIEETHFTMRPKSHDSLS